jgi:hypothetical protein
MPNKYVAICPKCETFRVLQNYQPKAICGHLKPGYIIPFIIAGKEFKEEHNHISLRNDDRALYEGVQIDEIQCKIVEVENV